MNPLSCDRLTGTRPYNDMAGIKKLSCYPDVPHTVTGLNDVSVNFQTAQAFGSACGIHARRGGRCSGGRLPYVSKHLPPYTDETQEEMAEEWCYDDLDPRDLSARAYVDNFGRNLDWDLIWRVLCLVLIAALIIGLFMNK